MRAGKIIGAALAVMVAAALVLAWKAPPVAAAGQQAEKPKVVDEKVRKPQVEKETITIHRSTDGEPVVVHVEKQQGQRAKVMTHAIQDEPLMAVLGGGPRLGIRIRDLAKEDVAKFKLPSQNGVAVEEVTRESAAEKAGVKAGDVVVQFDGENVRSAAQLTRLVRETAAGRTVKMGVVRDGKRLDLDVAPAEAGDVFNLAIAGEKVPGLEKHLETVPERGQVYRFERRLPEPGQPMPPGGAFRWRQGVPLPPPEGDVLQWFGDGGAPGNFTFMPSRGRLGVNVQELTPDLAAYFGVKDGLLVNSVQADTPAARAGIKAGDVIGTVNGKAVTTPDELIKELADKEGEVALGVTRDKKPLPLKATLEPRKAPARRAVVVGRPV
jgi:membrane-associated protease RseP (regulator of RpoE activity)